MASTIKGEDCELSQADREHSMIGCEVIYCCCAIVTRITLYHIFQDLLMVAREVTAFSFEAEFLA
jgi:hypothetical protein